VTKKVKRPNETPGPDAAIVSVCRGCCCGTQAKHPGTDHAEHLARLRGAFTGTGVRLRITDCLDACGHSNVVVVSPSAAGRTAGVRPVWLGEVLDTEPIDDIAAWVTAGGPGVTEPPGTLDLHTFAPSRRVRTRGEALG
jgi:(2Fe-2S) ferredoxin